MHKAAQVSLHKLGGVEEELVGELGRSLRVTGGLLVAASLEHKGPRSGQRSGNIYHLFKSSMSKSTTRQQRRTGNVRVGEGGGEGLQVNIILKQ